MSLRHATLTAVFISACYNPDPDNVQISCSAENPACPQNQSCVSGLCTDSADAAATPPDMAVSIDAGGEDMVQRSGCASGGGIALGAASACAGSFSKGKAATLCASGFTLCSKAAQVAPACATIGSFYAADVPVYYVGTPDNESCGAAAFGQLLAGCGTAGRLSTAKCMGFPRVIDVLGTWTTNDGTLGQASNSDPSQGVLCCPVGLTG